jgi:hypothetical protein
MPTSIPYDPSLVLGSLVDQEKLGVLLEIVATQATVDAAQERLHLHIQEKRSLDMIKRELIDMNIDSAILDASLEKISQEILEAAQEVATAQIAAGPKITALKKKMHAVKDLVSEHLESPIDYTQTTIKRMPLAAESLKMDAQYFAFSENKQSADDSTLESIGALVKDSAEFLGAKRSREINKNVQTQVAMQREKHSVSGVLVLTASCTHKNVTLLEPCVLDPDKALAAWNRLFTAEKINTQDLAALAKMVLEATISDKHSLNLLSGAAYGSSFVGMAYTLKEDSASLSDQEAERIGNKLGLLAGVQEASGLELDTSVVNEVASALTTQKVASHVSCITMGAIPKFQSQAAEKTAQEIIQFDAEKMQKELAAFANATESAQKTAATNTAEASIKRKIMQFQGAKIQNVMSGLLGADERKNKRLDINSLMTAFDNYITCINTEGQVGIPISYYVKSISKAQIIRLWLDKYYPPSGSESTKSSEETASKSKTEAVPQKDR